jgi:SAM-dependent methyltransferase
MTGMNFDFSAVAQQYAAYRPHYPPELAAALAERCTHRELAWEVGCGSGQLTQTLAPHFTRVIATDPSQGQLDAAPKLTNVEFRVAAAEASTLADACADLIVAAQAAHWFDWPKFVAEAARVAKPGALVALVSYGIVEVDDAPSVARFYHETVGPFWPASRRHVENGYRDLVWPWPPVAPPALAMRAMWTRDEFFGYVTTWSAFSRLVEQRGREPVDAFAAELAAEWPDNERREIRWPLTLKLARYA